MAKKKRKKKVQKPRQPRKVEQAKPKQTLSTLLQPRAEQQFPFLSGFLSGIRPIAGIQSTNTTPEGTPLVLGIAQFEHNNAGKIFRRLQAEEDFDIPDEDKSQKLLQPFVYLQTQPIPGFPPMGLGQRILAHLRLTPGTLEVEAYSEERLQYCLDRLHELFNDTIALVDVSFGSAEEAHQRRVERSRTRPSSPSSPEDLAKLEATIIQNWINSPLPALDGMTPLEAVKTPGGREKVLQVMAKGEQWLQAVKQQSSGFAPDYNKAKKLLGLE